MVQRTANKIKHLAISLLCCSSIAFSQHATSLPKPTIIEQGALNLYEIPISYYLDSTKVERIVSRTDKRFWASLQSTLISISSDTTWFQNKHQFEAFLINQNKKCDKGDSLYEHGDLFKYYCIGFDTINTVNTTLTKVHILNSRFDVASSTIDGVGLQLSDGYHFSPGNDLVYVYYQSGRGRTFHTKYSETIYGTFVNHSANPNTEIIVVEDGLILRALVEIEAGDEITAN